jgi:hypothetical protein
MPPEAIAFQSISAHSLLDAVGAFATGARGSVNSKRAPWPGVALAATVPPRRSTMRCTMLGPMPLPA